MTKAREKRFIGSGNTWVADGRYRGWKVTCKCGVTKVISSHHNHSLPPHMILRKLDQAGWTIGNDPKDDQCESCRRKSTLPKKDVTFAKQAITAALAPMVGPNGHRVSFNDVMIVAKTLTPDQAKELIGVLREQLPKREPKPKPVQPKEPESEYQKWLNEQ